MKFTRHPIALLLSLMGSGLCWASAGITVAPGAAGLGGVDPSVSNPQLEPLASHGERFAGVPEASAAPESSALGALDEQAVLHALFYSEVRPQQRPANGQWVALDEDRLGQVRGGFITDAGLEISFGIERAVFVNGNLVAATSLNVIDLANVTLETLRPNDGGSGNNPQQGGTTVPVNLVQIGPGNLIAPGTLVNGGLGTVIQNSLDGQAIRSITTIEATVNSLQVLRGLDLLSQIRGSIIESLPK